MPKQSLSLNDFSSGIQTIRDPRDLKNNELVKAQNIAVDKRGAIRTMGSVAEITDPTLLSRQTAVCKGGYGLAVLESDYETEAQTITCTGCLDFDGVTNRISKKLDIDSIVGATVTITTATAHNFSVGDNIYIVGTVSYNGDFEIQTAPGANTFTITHADNGNEGAAGNVYSNWSDVLSVGSEIFISGTTDNDGFYVIKVFLGTASTDWIMIVDSTVTTENNATATVKYLPSEEIIIVLSDAANAKVDTYSKNQNLWTDDQMTLDTTSGNLANNAKTAFYAIDGAIRACDGEFDNASIIQWFGLIKRTHFPSCTARDDYFDFYAKNNDLAIPTDGEIGDTYPADNTGFDLELLTPANSDSEWEAATYQIASSFIYDDNQESLLYVPSANNTFVVVEGDSVTISVHAHTNATGYNPRISGGRVYARISGSDDAWFLLCEINMRQGARATIDGTWEAWVNGATPATDIDTGLVISLSQNIDTYETINGYSHEEVSNSLGQDGEGWKTAVVANRRVFVANVRRDDESTGEPKTFADSIIYSQPNKFDTFPTSNNLIVVKGDSESYVCLKAYADRLLAFKQNSVQIINIASPSDTGWFKEDIKKYHGVYHPGAVCDTDFGPAWINKSGCYLYDGSQIRNLIWDKIDAIEWKDFIGAASDNISIIGYERHKKQLIVMRDCTGGQADSGDIYLYDFFTKSWVTGINIFTDAVAHTNFIHDWNGDLVIGYQFDATTIYIMKWSDTSAAKTGIDIITRDEDFGDLLHVKKIYKVRITYKSSVAQTNPFEYAIDGSLTFTDFDKIDVDGSEDTILDASVTNWNVAVLRHSTNFPIEVQSFRLRINPASSGTIDINDINYEKRTISKRVS